MSSSVTRRDVLRLAAGLGLSFLLPALGSRAAEVRGPERKKSLITLWLAGGPSQLETWDPHPGSKIGGPTQGIRTSIDGLQIAEFYPRLAEHIDSLSVIRSLVSKEGDHERGTYLLKTGYRPDPTLVHPALGAILAHELPDPTVAIPQHVSLGGGQWPARGGYLGDEYDAFKIFEPGRGVQNLRAPVSGTRQERRLENLAVINRAFQRGRHIAADRTQHEDTIERALRMVNSEQVKAFEIDDEPQAVRAAYGDHRFGRGCLIARRLVERGVRAVEVTLGGFDSHANNFEAHRTNGAILDAALSALLNDLKTQDLLASTVVLCLGEFGRTPKINPLDGRDHWPAGFSCLVGGGGLRRGVVIGATDPEGVKTDPDDPIPVKDLFATVLHVLGVDPAEQVITRIGRPMAFSEGAPIARLLG